MFFLAELQHQKRISLFLVKSAMQNYFHNILVLFFLLLMLFRSVCHQVSNQTNRWISSSGDYILLSANVSPTYSRHSRVLLLLRNKTRAIFSLLYSHLRWSFCGVMLLHVARVWAGSFAVLVFLHFSILAFRRGHTIKQLPWGLGITRLLHASELDQVYRSWCKLQASASQQEPVLGLFHLNVSRTLRVSRASVDGDNVDLYTF